MVFPHNRDICYRKKHPTSLWLVAILSSDDQFLLTGSFQLKNSSCFIFSCVFLSVFCLSLAWSHCIDCGIKWLSGNVFDTGLICPALLCRVLA